MKNFSILTVLAMTAAFASACGSSGNGSSAGGQPGAAPGSAPGGQSQPASCASAWSAYVAANPAGRTLTYALSTQMTAGTITTTTSRDTETDTVTESSDDHVTTTITTHHGSHAIPISKSEFASMCGNAGGTHPTNGSTILAQDSESIDVAAGHFDCNHLKIQVNSSGATSETWTDSQDFYLVKSVTTMTTSGNAVMTSVKELTQHN
jgi:hypothetical protein